MIPASDSDAASESRLLIPCGTAGTETSFVECGLWPIVPPTTAGTSGPTAGPGAPRTGPAPATGAGAGPTAGPTAATGAGAGPTAGPTAAIGAGDGPRAVGPTGPTGPMGPTGTGPVEATRCCTPIIALCSVTLVSEHT